MTRLRSPLESVRHWIDRGLHGAMTCAEFEDALVDYLDGSMGTLARRQVDLHTLLCPRCRRYLRAYDRARGLAVEALRESEMETLRAVPEDLVQAILSVRRSGSTARGS